MHCTGASLMYGSSHWTKSIAARWPNAKESTGRNRERPQGEHVRARTVCTGAAVAIPCAAVNEVDPLDVEERPVNLGRKSSR